MTGKHHGWLNDTGPGYRGGLCRWTGKTIGRVAKKMAKLRKKWKHSMENGNEKKLMNHYKTLMKIKDLYKSYSLTKKMRESVAVFSIIKVLRDPITHRVGGETVL